MGSQMCVGVRIWAEAGRTNRGQVSSCFNRVSYYRDRLWPFPLTPTLSPGEREQSGIAVSRRERTAKSTILSPLGGRGPR